jgi:hypothetical protein
MAYPRGELDGDHFNLLLRWSIDPFGYCIVGRRLCSDCVSNCGSPIEEAEMTVVNVLGGDGGGSLGQHLCMPISRPSQQSLPLLDHRYNYNRYDRTVPAMSPTLITDPVGHGPHSSICRVRLRKL